MYVTVSYKAKCNDINSAGELRHVCVRSEQNGLLTCGFGLVDKGMGGGVLSFNSPGDIRLAFLTGGGGGSFLPKPEARKGEGVLGAVCGGGVIPALRGAGPGEVEEERRENRDWSSLSWAVFLEGWFGVGEPGDGAPIPRLETDTPAAPSLFKAS